MVEWELGLLLEIMGFSNWKEVYLLIFMLGMFKRGIFM